MYYYGGGYGGIKTGSAVEQNYTEAFKWHSRAAAQGDISAKYKIALMLYEGNGVKQDKKKAVKIIKEMQNAGDEEAIAFLNKMLEEDLKNFSNLDAAE
ncbi:MAG: hypothetical protein LBH29_05415 [Elusimicrobiota bacterium]|nr:hypothetical protein [Elusimicrobiota bacterium]